MDKMLGAANAAKYRANEKLKETGVRNPFESWEVKQARVELSEHPTLQTKGGQRFADALEGVLAANETALTSDLSYRVKDGFCEVYRGFEKTLDQLIQQAERTQFLRILDGKFPKLDIRRRLEDIFPGCTGLTTAEMRAYGERFEHEAFYYRNVRVFGVEVARENLFPQRG